MSWIGAGQLAVLTILLLAITRPLGTYMANVFEGRPTFLSWPLGRLELLLYRLGGVDPTAEQSWSAYAGACLAFGLVNFLFFYALLRLQGLLPFNPNRFGTAMAPS